MPKLNQSLCILIGVQAICLGIGFWFQNQLVVSTTEREASESAWSELATSSKPMIGSIRSLTEHNLDWATVSNIIEQNSSADDVPQLAVLLTDAHGDLVGFNHNAAVDNWSAGRPVNWKAERKPAAKDGARFGRIVTPKGDRTAVLHSLIDHDRQLIVYAPNPTSPFWKTALLGSLPIASGLGFFWTLSLSVVATIVITSRFNLEASQRKAQLDHDALRNAQDLLRTRDAVIFGLAKLAESRDAETGNHLERISLYTTRLATALRPYPKYQRIVTPTFVRLLGISSVLHDIGKVGIEDTVLLKPGKLNDEEFRLMQQHTLVAGDCLKEIEERLGASNFLQTAREIALHHHERWDGNGYPYKLAGEDIPLAARIVAIADVYDALSSKRVYKDAFPHEQCVESIRSGAGSQFDPELVEVFLEIESEFAAIARRFAKPAGESPGRSSSQDLETLDQIANQIDQVLSESSAGCEPRKDDSHSIVFVG